MIFVKKIFEDKVDDVVHRKFERFSIGEFNNRALISVSKGKDLKIKASYDLADDLFGLIAENISSNATVKGKIIASWDFEKELDFEVEKFTKGKKFSCDINTELTPAQMKNIYSKFKLNFILLAVDGGGFKLTVGKSLPKPGKELKDNFCKAVLPVEIVKEFAWDVGDFKKLICKHKFVVDEVVSPEGVTDFAEMRKLAKRKGKIFRELEVDGNSSVKEKSFLI